MDIQISEIVKCADELVRRFGTRNPYRLAEELGIEIIPREFKLQKGAYKVILRNRFIFIKNDLHPATKNIVLLHEIGHDVLHREEAVKAGSLNEFDIFEMQDICMEYEANVFAAQISLPDEDILRFIEQGYSVWQTAEAMGSDVNLVALKVDILIAQGYGLKRQEYQSNFLIKNN